ncbi:hypothetical protein, partial [Klebsiella pneumoniae]|uniref:hypothetical protein n=1 Tax=Klebsiella pneumoniae TaxID=573 RepID=UPI00210D8ACC
EAIIPEELWEDCVRILNAQRATAKPTARVARHLFAGFAQCACGTKMYARGASRKYVCEKCRNKIPSGDLEAIYREQLTHILVAPDEIEAHNQAAIEVMREKQRLIDTVEGELRRIATEDQDLFDL